MLQKTFSEILGNVLGKYLPCVPLHKRQQGKFRMENLGYLVLKELEPDCSETILLRNSVLLFCFASQRMSHLFLHHLGHCEI